MSTKLDQVISQSEPLSLDGPDLLPIAVIVAIVIFVAREVMATYRVRRKESRKLTACKQLIANEITENVGFVSNAKTFGEAFKEISLGTSTSFRRASDEIVEVIIETVYEEDGEDIKITRVFRTERLINERYNELAIEIAELDMKMFSLANEAYTSLDGVEKAYSDWEYIADDHFIADGIHGGVGDKALEASRKARNACNTLYEYCTGNSISFD